MSNLDQALAVAQQSVPECLAVGYVDVDSGLLMGVRTVDSHPREVLELVSAATADLFQGQNVLAIETMFKKARGVTTDEHYFQEIVVFSTNLIHVFVRTKQYPTHVVIFVVKGSTNLGMALSKARLAVPAVAAAA